MLWLHIHLRLHMMNISKGDRTFLSIHPFFPLLHSIIQLHHIILPSIIIHNDHLLVHHPTSEPVVARNMVVMLSPSASHMGIGALILHS
jgi:hypothetical protein